MGPMWRTDWRGGGLRQGTAWEAIVMTWTGVDGGLDGERGGGVRGTDNRGEWKDEGCFRGSTDQNW